MYAVWKFLVGRYTRVVFAIWVSLESLILYFPKEPCLSPDLSSYRVSMQNQTFCCSHATLHLFQNCLYLASMPYIGEGGNAVWTQVDLLLGFLRVWLFSDKLSDKFPIDESVVFLDSRSALTFNQLGRYFAVIVI